MNYIPDKKIGGKTDFRDYLAIAYVKTIYIERETQTRLCMLS